MKGIGILPGPRISYVDHLVPLCHCLGFPILCTERSVKELIEIYYPGVNVLWHGPSDYCLDEPLSGYSVFVFPDHSRKAHGTFQFAEYVCTHKVRSIYSLHGNSDKNRRIHWIERLVDEDIVLLYGPQMVDYMEEKGIKDYVKNYVLTGNYRLEYHLNRQQGNDSARPRFFPKSDKKTILYAPTWSFEKKNSEKRFDYSTFFEAHPFVLDQIPDGFQVIVKVHPHLIYLHGGRIDAIKERYAGHPQICFLDDFPLIYPLLEICDLYIGDYSSIGYDFLFFDRPLFFLNSRSASFLQCCGISIFPSDYSRLYDVIQHHLNQDGSFSAMRKRVYAYAFGERKSLGVLKREIMAVLHEPY